MSFSSWFRSSKPAPSRRSSRRSRPRPASRPGVEQLEDRTLLTAGALDPSFGAGGIVTTALTSGTQGANSIVLQGDGKIVVAGNGGTDFGLARYNTNGTLDATFGSGGKVVTDINRNSFDSCTALALQA